MRVQKLELIRHLECWAWLVCWALALFSLRHPWWMGSFSLSIDCKYFPGHSPSLHASPQAQHCIVVAVKEQRVRWAELHHIYNPRFCSCGPHERPGPPSPTADGSFIRAVAAVHLAVADLVGGEANRGVVGTGVLGGLAGSRLAGLFVWLVLAVDVAVAHPALGDALACWRDVQYGQRCWRQLVKEKEKKKRKKGIPASSYCNLILCISNMYAYLILKTFSNVGSSMIQ